MGLHIKSRISCCVVFVFVSSMLIGCGAGDGLSRSPLTGTVTYNGQPLDHGMVCLMPVDGTKGPQGSGDIASDGTYEIVTANKSGAVVGTHKVIVQCREELSDKELRQMRIGKLLIPNRYASYSKTPLKVEVPSSGEVFNVELTD